MKVRGSNTSGTIPGPTDNLMAYAITTGVLLQIQRKKGSNSVVPYLSSLVLNRERAGFLFNLNSCPPTSLRQFRTFWKKTIMNLHALAIVDSNSLNTKLKHFLDLLMFPQTPE